MSEEGTAKIEFWAIVELFGHQKMAGFVTEVSIGGAGFVRVDVPELDGKPGFTRIIGAAAIYALNPTTKELALHVVGKLDPRPIEGWMLPEPQAEAVEDQGEDWEDPNEPMWPDADDDEGLSAPLRWQRNQDFDDEHPF